MLLQRPSGPGQRLRVMKSGFLMRLLLSLRAVMRMVTVQTRASAAIRMIISRFMS